MKPGYENLLAAIMAQHDDDVEVVVVHNRTPNLQAALQPPANGAGGEAGGGVALVGDLHGNWQTLRLLSQRFPQLTGVLQVGDFGFHPALLRGWEPLAWPVYALDGNHEYFPMLQLDAEAPYEVAKGLFHVPRGIVFRLGGIWFGCCGGGESLDKAQRVPGEGWFPEERVLPEQIDRLVNHPQGWDILVTHTPMPDIRDLLLPPVRKEDWGLPDDWIDKSSYELLRLTMEQPGAPWVSGHLHKSGRMQIPATDDDHRRTFWSLDINEVLDAAIVLEEPYA